MSLLAQAVVAAVAKAFSVTPGDIIGPTRDELSIAARFTAAILLRKHAGYSTPKIGRALKRYHSSIVHALRQEERILADIDYAVAYRRAEAEFMQAMIDLVGGISPPKPPLKETLAKVRQPKRVPRPLPTPDEIWAKLLGGERTIAFTRLAHKKERDAESDMSSEKRA